MIRKTIGTILVVVGGILIVVLLASGMIFPHIIGPTLVTAVGAIVLGFPRKVK